MTPFQLRLAVTFAALAGVDVAAAAVYEQGVRWAWLYLLAVLLLCLINLPALLPLGVWLVASRGNEWLPPFGPAALGGFACLSWATLAAWPARGVSRDRPGRCWRCGYDLRADVTGRCPECDEPTGAALFRLAADADRRRRY